MKLLKIWSARSKLADYLEFWNKNALLYSGRFWTSTIGPKFLWCGNWIFMTSQYHKTCLKFFPIIASANTQYDNRLFIELPVHYMKIPSSEHGENIGRIWGEHVVHTNCFFVFVLTFRTTYVNNMFSHVLPMFWAWNFHVLNW